MELSKKVILILLASLVVRELWTLFPYDPTRHSYFPFYEMPMTFQTYIYFPCHIVANSMVVYAFFLLLPAYYIFFNTWLIMQVIEFVDFFGRYNVPWFKLQFIGIEVDFGITILRMLSLILVLVVPLIIKFLKWLTTL